jgi:folate-dependent phosphoribosylglycinamide formyltransferase PurN
MKQKKQNISTDYKIAIGVSGSGTTFEAIAQAIKKGEIPMDLVCVFVDRECLAIKRAKQLGIQVIQRKIGEGITNFHSRIIRHLIKSQIDFVVLAGYLQLFPITNSDPFLVLNSHPAAIPYFGGEGMWGIKVHEAVLRWAGITKFKYPYTFSTIHVATSKYDRGPVVGLKKLKISRNDTPETLAKKLLPIEHQNYIEVLKRLSENLIDYPEYPKEFILP